MYDDSPTRRAGGQMSDELAREHVETLLAAARELADACTMIAKQLRPPSGGLAPPAGRVLGPARSPASVAADLLEQTADSTGETRRLLAAVLDALVGSPSSTTTASRAPSLVIPPPPPIHVPTEHTMQPDESLSGRGADEPPMVSTWSPAYGGSTPSTGGSLFAHGSAQGLDGGVHGRHALDETGAWRMADIYGPGGRHSTENGFGGDDYGGLAGSAVSDVLGAIPLARTASGAELATPAESVPPPPFSAESVPAAFTWAPGTGREYGEPPDPGLLATTVRQVEASRRHLQAALLTLREALGTGGDVSLLALVERSLSAVTAAADQLRDALDPEHAEQVLPGEARYCCAMPWERLSLVPALVALAPATVPGATKILTALGYDAWEGAAVDGQPQVGLAGQRYRGRVVLQQLRLAGSGEWQLYLDWADSHGQQRSDVETLGPAELTDDEVARRVDDAFRRRLS
ncbi:MAG TPA: hypothetical protein VLJ59_09430 [Mycobacteriales bacterium]|nr:hypothetical protein [Mycobacteriales bacterium]